MSLFLYNFSLIPSWKDELGLSLERIGHVYVMARSLREARGRRIDETLQRMAAAFGVEDMSDLPDERWREMTIWLNKQWG